MRAYDGGLRFVPLRGSYLKNLAPVNRKLRVLVCGLYTHWSKSHKFIGWEQTKTWLIMKMSVSYL